MVARGDNAKTNPWRADVAERARAAVRDVVVEGHPVLYSRETAVAIAIVYRLAMPKKWLRPTGGLRPAAPPFPSVKPDTDKLDRAVLDAITYAGNVWQDDAQATYVVGLRCYVLPGEWTGAVVRLGFAERDGDLVVIRALDDAQMCRRAVLDVRLDHATNRVTSASTTQPGGAP